MEPILKMENEAALSGQGVPENQHFRRRRMKASMCAAGALLAKEMIFNELPLFVGELRAPHTLTRQTYMVPGQDHTLFR